MLKAKRFQDNLRDLLMTWSRQRQMCHVHIEEGNLHVMGTAEIQGFANYSIRKFLFIYFIMSWPSRWLGVDKVIRV